MTSVYPTPDSEDNASDISTAVVKTPPPAYVVSKDDFNPKGLVPGSSLDKLAGINILKMRMNKTLYNATSAQDIPNRFLFLDDSDRQVFVGHETSDRICRCAVGRTRSYSLGILSEADEVKLEIRKDYSCLSSLGCCSFIPGQNVGHFSTILDDHGQPYGEIIQKFDLMFPNFQIQDAEKCPRFDVISLNAGCCLPFAIPWKSCNNGQIFAIYRPESRYEIGYVGIEEEGGKNSFVKFPQDAILSDRILLLGTLVHLHILFFTNCCSCQQ